MTQKSDPGVVGPVVAILAGVFLLGAVVREWLKGLLGSYQAADIIMFGGCMSVGSLLAFIGIAKAQSWTREDRREHSRPALSDDGYEVERPKRNQLPSGNVLKQQDRKRLPSGGVETVELNFADGSNAIVPMASLKAVMAMDTVRRDPGAGWTGSNAHFTVLREWLIENKALDPKGKWTRDNAREDVKRLFNEWNIWRVKV